MSLLTCPACSTPNDADRRFCVECGTRLAAGCPVCGTVNPPEAKFCGQCGTNLAAPAAGPAVVQPIAERRLVSVLFLDLVGFTTASEARDAEDTRDLLTRYYDAAREIVGRYGGTIEKFIGDAVMGVWGTPAAHEDDAERAVRAALELVNAVPRLEGADGQLQARAGVLTGEAAVAIGLEGQGMIAGDLVNTASRLQSAARPGTVLVGDATHRAASGAISFEPAGERELKGKELPVAVWEAVSVVARRGGEGRAAMLEPPFVGRDDEVQLLKDLFHATAREGKPRLVTLSGAAGIGKSRILWEFEKYLDGVVENVFWNAGRSPSYGEGISYWALVEMLRARCGILDADDPAGRPRQGWVHTRAVSSRPGGAALDRGAGHGPPRPRPAPGGEPRGAVRSLADPVRAHGGAVARRAWLLGPAVGRSGHARLHRERARLGALVADPRARRSAPGAVRAPARLGPHAAQRHAHAHRPARRVGHAPAPGRARAGHAG